MFNPGFRISLLDMGVLIMSLSLAFFMAYYDKLYAIMILYVVGHFFLFCNIIRISRKPEFIWAVFFIGLNFLHYLYAIPSYPVLLVIMSCLTLLLVILEIKSPAYHGILWEKLNPNLPHWYQNLRSKK